MIAPVHRLDPDDPTAGGWPFLSSPRCASGDDNERVLLYAHGTAHEVGTFTAGRLADMVLWNPAYFGAEPQLVPKADYPAWGVTGDLNASTETSQPLILGPQVGAYGATAAELSCLTVRASNRPRAMRASTAACAQARGCRAGSAENTEPARGRGYSEWETSHRAAGRTSR
ncbi:hypothetical protein [Streptomyces pratensis]|uniref:hypothetical protein n=1 Tax=Streptomyces pratensis TaxID=1169025 RepID=UPI003639070A